MTISTKIRSCAVGIAIPAAVAGLVLAATVPASAHTTTTNFNSACVGIPNSTSVDPVPTTAAHSVTVTHPVANTYNIQTGPQTIAGVGGTVAINLNRLQVVYKIDNPTLVTSVSVVAGSGSGITGTPTVTRVDSSRNASATGEYILLNGGANSTIAGAGVGGAGSNTTEAGLTAVAPGPFQLPAVQVVTTAPDLDVWVDTDGDAAKYGNAKNFMTFLAKGRLIVFTGLAPTTCLPTDTTFTVAQIKGTPSVLGTSPTLNGGAGNLHP